MRILKRWGNWWRTRPIYWQFQIGWALTGHSFRATLRYVCRQYKERLFAVIVCVVLPLLVIGILMGFELVRLLELLACLLPFALIGPAFVKSRYWRGH